MIYVVALVGAALPLWSSHAVPMVDLPQHLHLISVLHRLGDASTIYPELFARRPEITPYLGYYYAVATLNWLMPLELANRLFLTGYVVGLPLSLAFLLKSLKRSAWPSLLAVPFAYGDSFGWGFINYCAALPLGFLACGLFIRAIEDEPRQKRWAVLLGVTLSLVLLFHVQVFAWLAGALPLLLVTSGALRGPAVQWLKERRYALYGVIPGVALFAAWFGPNMLKPADIRPGEPWHQWGPMFSEANLAFKPLLQNRAELFGVLSGLLRDGSDARAVVFAFSAAGLGAALAVALWLKGAQGNVLRDKVIVLAASAVAAIACWPMDSAAKIAVTALAAGAVLVFVGPAQETKLSRARLPLIALLALLLFFSVPFDMRGFVYYFNTRYAHLFAALLVCCVPEIEARFHKLGLVAGAVVAIACGWPLAQGFKQFDQEEAPLEALHPWAQPKPKVMGLVYNPASRVMTHPVYLHASTVVARERGGVTNFSFATTPHSPLMYQEGKTPPTFPSEWRPDTMSWESQGRWYDTFVIKGASPEQVLGPHLAAGELEVAAHQGDFWLVRRPAGR
ncbi:MAG: hypothetical protein QM723_07580 [Myxococcaceae bacterium]